MGRYVLIFVLSGALGASVFAWSFSNFRAQVEGERSRMLALEAAHVHTMLLRNLTQRRAALAVLLEAQEYRTGLDLDRLEQDARLLGPVFGGWVVLTETGTGIQLLNTRAGAGDPLPGEGVQHVLAVDAAERHSLRIGQPVLSDAFLGPVAGTRVATFVAVFDAPLSPTGTTLTLSLAFDVSDLSETLSDLPQGVAALVLDGSGAVVAQSRSALPGSAVLSRVRAIAHGADGSWVRARLDPGNQAPMQVMVRSLEHAPGWRVAVLQPVLPDTRAILMPAATRGMVVFALTIAVGWLVLILQQQKRLKDMEQQRTVETEGLARETERARVGVQAGERAKFNLLWRVGHEFRTPLNGVLGSLDLLERESLNQDARRYLDLAQISGRRLRVLIEIALDLVELDLQRVVHAKQPFDPRCVIETVLSSCRRGAIPDDRQLDLRIAPDLPRCLIGDGPRIGRVLEYLVCHAIEIAEASVIGVDIDWSPIDHRRGEISFLLTDSGAGFSHDELALLSRDIGRLEAGGHAPLGVVAAGKLLDLMGSALDISSTSGLGTRFRFTVVLEQASPEHEDYSETA